VAPSGAKVRVYPVGGGTARAELIADGATGALSIFDIDGATAANLASVESKAGLLEIANGNGQIVVRAGAQKGRPGKGNHGSDRGRFGRLDGRRLGAGGNDSRSVDGEVVGSHSTAGRFGDSGSDPAKNSVSALRLPAVEHEFNASVPGSTCQCVIALEWPARTPTLRRYIRAVDRIVALQGCFHRGRPAFG
jgi:hypothetical protein